MDYCEQTTARNLNRGDSDVANVEQKTIAKEKLDEITAKLLRIAPPDAAVQQKVSLTTPHR